MCIDDGRERSIDALVELLQRQPALRVVLPQPGRRRLAVGISDAQIGSVSHMILRIDRACRTSSQTIYLDMIVGKS